MLRSLWPEFSKRGLPGFRVNAEQISVLTSPIEFYTLLVRGVRESKYRISLSSLYIGSGEMEAFLLEELLKTSNKNPYLRVRIILDRYRGMRFSNGEASARRLYDLLNRATNPSNFEFVLYRSVQLPRLLEPFAFTGLPEVFGTFHVKTYLFDDSVLLTGANLAQEYFLNRKDRYLLVDECREFANYVDDFNAIFADQGERIRRGKILENRNSSFASQQKNVTKGAAIFLHMTKPSATQAQQFSQLVERFDAQPALLSNFASAASPPPDPALLEDLRNAIDVRGVNQAFDRVDAIISRQRRPKSSQSDDVLLFPTFQIPRCGLRHDEEMLLKLLSLFSQPGTAGRFTLASGYFNPSSALLSHFRQFSHQVDMEFVAGSPRNSSFYKAGPVRGLVPLVYRTAFCRWIEALDHQPNARFFEFFHQGATFHAKGIWASLNTPSSGEYLTLFGSSNYSQRSFSRDVEGQFWVFTKNPELKAHFERDREMLLEHTTQATADKMKLARDPKVGPFGRLLHWILQGFA